MKKKMIVLLATLFALSAPLAAFAMDHGGESKKERTDHGSMDGMDHGSMKEMDHDEMMENMVMLGKQTENGVQAAAHLKDVKEAMAEAGMEETHHFMVNFVDVESGDPIETGMVAVKIKDPSGSEGKPVKLMGMQGHFGADISLTEKGTYEFQVGTKLKDGSKRRYSFDYEVK
ncbi:MAG: hypothetical protein R6V08_05905 [Desulfuromonadales bacterium]